MYEKNKTERYMEMTNKTRNKLKERLENTQKWADNFLEIEKHREISKKALRQLNKDKPFLGFIFETIYIPTRIWNFISDIIWWNKYHKACKEIEIIRKELKIND